MKYFYDANVGRTAHLWKVHDTYCRFMRDDDRGKRELHHDKGTREVCHKCREMKQLIAEGFIDKPNVSTMSPSNSFERKRDGNKETNQQTNQVHRGAGR